jgi:hypothetical protein
VYFTESFLNIKKSFIKTPQKKPVRRRLSIINNWAKKMGAWIGEKDDEFYIILKNRKAPRRDAFYYKIGRLFTEASAFPADVR